MKKAFIVITSLLLGLSSAFAAQTNRIFVTNERSNTISVINGYTLEVEASIDIGFLPRGIGLSPDGSELYVAVSEENKIAVVDPKTLKILRSLQAVSYTEAFAVYTN